MSRISFLRSLANILLVPFLFFFVSVSNTVTAVPVGWVLDYDGNWSTASNWTSDPVFPGPSDDVIIDVSGPTVRTITHDSGTTTILSLISEESIFLSGGYLEITGVANFNSLLQIGNGTLINTTVSGSGNVLISAINGSSVLDGVTLDTDLTIGTSGASATATLIINDGLTLNNGATVTLQQGPNSYSSKR